MDTTINTLKNKINNIDNKIKQLPSYYNIIYNRDNPTKMILEFNYDEENINRIINIYKTNYESININDDKYLSIVISIITMYHEFTTGEEFEDEEEQFDSIMDSLLSIDIDETNLITMEIEFKSIVDKKGIKHNRTFIHSKNDNIIYTINDSFDTVDWIFKIFLYENKDMINMDNFNTIIKNCDYLLKGFNICVTDLYIGINDIKDENKVDELLFDKYNPMSGSCGSDMIYFVNLLLNNLDKINTHISNIDYIIDENGKIKFDIVEVKNIDISKEDAEKIFMNIFELNSLYLEDDDNFMLFKSLFDVYTECNCI